mmetsp:Transcript_38748/g.110787  ORF Transcript_38748/g.110787 Transcript_38748/m.110787 type:complete len:302 (-) Transcript_38748:12-917(-)
MNVRLLSCLLSACWALAVCQPLPGVWRPIEGGIDQAMRWIAAALRLTENDRTDRPGTAPFDADKHKDDDARSCPEPLVLKTTDALRNGTEDWEFPGWNYTEIVWDNDHFSDFLVVALDSGEKGTAKLHVQDLWIDDDAVFWHTNHTRDMISTSVPSDKTSGTYESVIVVLTANVEGGDGILAAVESVECEDGPCEFKLLVSEHDGACILRAVDGEVFGVKETIDLETLPLFPPPPAPPGGRVPRLCPGNLLGPFSGSLEEGESVTVNDISGPFSAPYFIIALDSLAAGDSDLYVYDPSDPT